MEEGNKCMSYDWCIVSKYYLWRINAVNMLNFKFMIASRHREYISCVCSSSLTGSGLWWYYENVMYTGKYVTVSKFFQTQN